MFKLKDFAEGAEKQQNAIKIKNELDKLPSKISEIKSYEVGINMIPSERAADIVLISKFNNRPDLENYIIHPEHKLVADFIQKRRETSWSVDYFD